MEPSKTLYSKEKKIKNIERILRVKDLDMSSLPEERIPLLKDEAKKKFSIGSDRNCDIRLKGLEIAPKHCQLELINQEGELLMMLTDLGSPLGLKVNGKKIAHFSSVFLQDNDKIMLGHILLSFESIQSLVESKIEAAIEAPIEVAPVPFSFKEIDQAEGEKEDDFIEDFDDRDEDDLPPEPPPISSHPQSNSNLPSLIRRLMALMIDIFLVFLIWGQLSKTEFQDEAGSMVKVLLKILPWDQIHFFNYDQAVFYGVPFAIGVFIYILYGLLGMKILGVTIGQASLSIYGGDSFIWNRFGGVVRLFMGLITSPFLVFDFVPHLMGRRSLKEFMSMTRLEVKHPLMGLIAFVVMVPILVVSIFLSPLLLTYEYDPNFKIIQYKMDMAKEGLEPVESKSMHLSFSLTNSDSFVFFPGFEIIKKGIFKMTHATLDFYDFQSSSFGEFKAAKKIVIGRILYNSKEKINAFNNLYPSLDAYLVQNKALIFDELGEKKSSGGNTGTQEMMDRQEILPPLPIEAAQDLEKLLTKALELNLHSMPNFLLNKEFFLYGYAYLQKKLLSRYFDFTPSATSTRFEVLDWGGMRFLTQVQKNKNINEENNMNQRRILFPLQTLNGLLFHLSFYDSLQFERGELQFFSQIASPMKWTFEENKEVPQDASADIDSKASILSALDEFGVKETDSKRRIQLEDLIYSHYVNLGKLSLNKSNDEKFKRAILKEIVRIRDVSFAISGEEASPTVNLNSESKRMPFLENMKGLERALREKDIQYFMDYDAQQSFLNSSLPPGTIDSSSDDRIPEDAVKDSRIR